MSMRSGLGVLHRVSATFTATHLVAMFGIAVLAPSVLYATGTFTNVAVTDASTGATAAVDTAHRIHTYDSVAGYTQNPAYAVNISDLASAATGLHQIYSVPQGKILLIRSFSWAYFNNTEGSNNYWYLYDAGNNILFNTEGLHIADNSSATFEPGILVPAGPLQAAYFGSGSARIYIQGDLIPAGAARLVSQIVRHGRSPSPMRPQ